MNYRILKLPGAAMLALLIWGGSIAFAMSQTPRDSVEMLRADLKANRNDVLSEEMNFTAQESEAFWPVYRNYRAEMDKVTDRVVKLVFEYADLFPNVPETKAKELLKQYGKVEADALSVKRKYLKKFGKILPASKVFRFAQIDNRLDLAARVGLAAWLPIMPAG